MFKWQKYRLLLLQRYENVHRWRWLSSAAVKAKSDISMEYTSGSKLDASLAKVSELMVIYYNCTLTRMSYLYFNVVSAYFTSKSTEHRHQCIIGLLCILTAGLLCIHVVAAVVKNLTIYVNQIISPLI